MDISALNLSPDEVIKKINEKKAYVLSEYTTMTAYNMLLDYIKCSRMALVCVASSMTNLVKFHIEKMGVKPPLPTNFRITKGMFMEFDFPETVEVEKRDGNLTLRFDKLMMSVMDRAANIYEGNLRTIKPFQVSEISFMRDGGILVVVSIDEITTEWFRFILVSKNDLTNKD